MKYKYELSEPLVRQVAGMDEFAMGGTQLTVKTKDGKEYSRVLISACRYIVAIRDYTDLPFDPDDIESVYQTAEDKDPKERGGWHYWDNWK